MENDNMGVGVPEWDVCYFISDLSPLMPPSGRQRVFLLSKGHKVFNRISELIKIPGPAGGI